MKNPRQTNPQPVSGARSAGEAQGDLRYKAAKVATQVGEAAQDMAEQAKQSASSLAAEANQTIKGILNQQLAVGADLAGEVAHSARAAAGNLNQNAPQLAGLVRNAADKIESFSQDMRGRSIDEIMEIASGYARRQPLIIFGAAAALGFLAFRVVKSAPPMQESGMGNRSGGQRGLSPDVAPPLSPHVSPSHGRL
jgi:ElaB/YqjD/DUF883 family membrane-anchored ribosome-binding protein